MNKLTLAYMAGLFDGEGYIGILKRQKKEEWNIEYFLQISIGQNDGALVDWVKENFGGFLHHVKRDGSYSWIASNQAALKVLKEIEPYLKYKRPQAILALEFYKNRELKRPIPQKELARREMIYLKMKSLKREFTKSSYC